MNGGPFFGSKRSPARSPSSHAARTRTTKAETREGGRKSCSREASLPFSPRPERREGALLAERAGECNLGCLSRQRRLAQQIIHSEPVRKHREPAVEIARPLGLGPIAIELEAVFIRVAQVQCFADAVIGGAVEGNARGDQTPQRVGERRPGRIHDREMEKARGAARRWRPTAALPGIEADMVVVAAGRDERRLRRITLHQLETEHAAIEAERAIEIGDSEMNMADPGAWHDRARRQSGAAGGLLRALIRHPGNLLRMVRRATATSQTGRPARIPGAKRPIHRRKYLERYTQVMAHQLRCG